MEYSRWKPNGTGKDRRQPEAFGPGTVYWDVDRIKIEDNAYPWVRLPDGRLFSVEVRCAVCHAGLCYGSEMVKSSGFTLPCMFVPVCKSCLAKARKHPEWDPEDDLKYPLVTKEDDWPGKHDLPKASSGA